MLDEFRAADEDQLLVLEEEFRDLALKEAQILEQLTQVHSAKQRVRRLVAEKKNRYAPIFTLPDELLVYIVEVAQQSADSGSALIEVFTSHISQRFRCAVLGAPTLWSSIELRWGAECDEERFAAYLQRSQVCALSVRLVYSSYHGKSECDYEEVPNELATVVQHISRIRRLVLDCGGMGLAFDDTMAHFSQLKAPCLESVDISCVSVLDSWGEDGPWPYPSIFNNGAPRLTTLKLTNAYPGSWSPWIPSLTSLDLRGMQGASTAYSSVLRSLLAGCPQLVDLTLDGSTYVTSADDFHPAESISMPSLRTLKGLRLDSNEPDALLLGALHFFHAPAIEVLQFSGVHGLQISTFFNGVAASKFPALRSLTFASSPIRCKGDCHALPVRPEALRNFPVLASLTVVNVCHLKQLMADLLALSNDADGAARGLFALKSLTLRYKDGDDFGIASWPRLPSSPLDQADAQDPLLALRELTTSRADTYPVHVRLPRSRFFTEQDFKEDATWSEIIDVQPLLRSLGCAEDDEQSDTVLVNV